MDLAPTIVPKSDQLNADDLIAGPCMVTIVKVTSGNAEQPVNIITEEFGEKRPYKPSKGMRRVMVEAWGKDSSTYGGHRLTLFRDPHVRFGPDEVGGIRISHLSHINGPLTVKLTVGRGKRDPYIVQPLDAAPVVDEGAVVDYLALIEEQEELAGLQELWQQIIDDHLSRNADLIAAKDARKAALTADEQEELI